MTKKRWTLRELYDQCPPVACEPGCDACCGPTPFTRTELARVASRLPFGAEVAPVRLAVPGLAGLPGMADTLVVVKQDENGFTCCGFKKPGGGCMVYEDRPFICRAYATFSPCPKGRMAAEPVDEKRMAAMTRAYRRIDQAERRR